MAKHIFRNVVEQGRTFRRKIERRQVLIGKIKKAGNWVEAMNKLTTKVLTSYCGKPAKGN